MWNGYFGGLHGGTITAIRRFAFKGDFARFQDNQAASVAFKTRKDFDPVGASQKAKYVQQFVAVKTEGFDLVFRYGAVNTVFPNVGFFSQPDD